MSVVRRAETVPKSISKSMKKTFPCSNNGLLATELFQDQSDDYALWRDSLPKMEDLQEAMPAMWEPELCQLLPPKAKTILLKQRYRIGQDWDAMTAANLDIPMGLYRYYWLLISTRTFYYTPPRRKTPPADSDECLAIVPYADYFNHSDAGCKVSYTRSQYSVMADRSYHEGEEVLYHTVPTQMISCSPSTASFLRTIDGTKLRWMTSSFHYSQKARGRL